ncbi:secreted protein, partial [gut metagenome]
MSFKKSLLGLALVAASGAAMALPNVAVLATGGTIAGAGASSTGSAYQAGKV